MRWAGAAVAMAMLGAACGQSTGGRTPRIVDRGPVEPAGPVVASADLDQFSAALLREVATEQPGNVVVSPASFALAFALAEAGAQGATRDEIAAVFGFDQGSDIGDVLTALTAPTAGDGPVLTVANGFWETGRLPISDTYRTRVRDELRSELSTVAYRKLAAAVNSWVAGKTNGRITDLVPEDAVDSDTVAILVNAIYLLAKWQYPLHEVGNRSFEGAGAVPMMEVKAAFQSVEGDGFRAIRLPYVGGTASMLIVVPDELATFDPARLAEIRRSLSSSAVTQLTMPTWDFATTLDAVPTLKRLGIGTAFGGQADFCPMIEGACAPGDVTISAVFHRANITVDTEGTEAAAATAIVMEAAAAPIEPPKSFRVDRPFLFEIIHEPTGTPLFVGRVIDPTA